MNQPKCYSYIRFSTPEQSKGDSHRRQTEAAELWANKHGMILDNTTRLKDLGLSAYHGAHKDKGALGVFLDLVKKEEIIPGSVLLVESLDRLSREEITEALETFLGIIRRGIKIVTLGDNDREYTKETVNANVGDLIVSLTIMSRAHEESVIKANRLKEAWGNKRNKLAERKLTARAPAWLRLSEDKTTFHLIPERAAIVKRIFEMKLQGIGGESIAKILNQEKDTWNQEGFEGRKGGNLPNGWRKSYLDKILNTRAVIGEFQPHKFVKEPADPHKFIKKPDGKRVRQAAGEPIPDYFPSVVSVDLYHAVQDRFSMNKGKGGRTGATSNLFSHIAKCGYCHAPMQFISKGPKPKGGQYLLCDNARRGKGCHRYTIRYPDFEKLVLRFCKRLVVSDLLPDAEQAKSGIEVVQNRLSAIRGENTSLRAKIKNLGEAIEDSPDKRVRTHLQLNMTSLMDKVEALKEQKRAATQELAKLSSAGKNTQEQINNLNELIAYMESPREDISLVRMKLRDKLRSLIDRIEVHPVGRKRMTMDRVEELIQTVLDVYPETSPDELERLRALSIDKIDNKDYGQLTIYFHGGSIRTIHLKDKLLSTDFDREAGELVNRWLEGGVEKSETFRKDILN